MTTVVCVKRKRGDDPVPELSLPVKRSRWEQDSSAEFHNASQMFIFQSSTSAATEESAISELRSLFKKPELLGAASSRLPIRLAQLKGLPAQQSQAVEEEDEMDVEGGVADLPSNDIFEAVNSPGIVVSAPKEQALITCNGVPAVRLTNSDSDDFVFDLYLGRGPGNVEIDDGLVDVHEIESEHWFVGEDDDTESDAVADDEEDSNDENHWKNDYPDEEDDQSDSDQELADALSDVRFIDEEGFD